MKTHIKRSDQAIVISLQGKLEFDTHIPLREQLHAILKETRTDSTPKNIIFNLEKLEFVGSSGISSFIQTLQEFNGLFPHSPKYCSVKSEFKRMIHAFDEAEAFQFFENEARALSQLDH